LTKRENKDKSNFKSKKSNNGSKGNSSIRRWKNRDYKNYKSKKEKEKELSIKIKVMSQMHREAAIKVKKIN